MNSALSAAAIDKPRASLCAWTKIGPHLALAILIATCGRYQEPAAIDRELLRVLADWRPTVGRVADVTAYRPCQPIGETDLGSLLCTPEGYPEDEARLVPATLVRAIQKSGTRTDSAALHARALWRLLWYRRGDPRSLEDASRDLERAVALDPRNHRRWNDLTIIHLARAAEHGDPRYLLSALATSARAVQLAPVAAAPRFNAALVLDLLALRGQAAESWQQVLRYDRGSGWAREAVLYLALGEQRRDPLPTPDLIARRVHDPDTDPAALRQLAIWHPQESREAAFENLLPDWGEASLAGSPDAEKILRRMRPLAEALFEQTRDRSLLATLQQLKDLADDDAKRDLARGHLAFREGRRALASMADQRARHAFDEAVHRLSQGASPFLPWALLGVAACDLRAGRYESAIEAADRLVHTGQTGKFPILVSLSHWTSGLARGKNGSFGQAHDHFLAALATLEAAGETRNVAFVLGLIAETQRFLGNSAGEWHSRHRALLLSRPVSSRQLHNLLWDTGLSLRRDGLPELALIYQDEGLRLAERSDDSHMRAEARMRRSAIYLEVGDEPAALADLDAAESARHEFEDAGMRARFGSHLAVARATALRQRAPTAALELLNGAITDYRAGQIPLRLTEALLERSRNHAANGLTAKAVSDLAEAIDIFEHQRSSAGSVADRLSFARTARQLYDRMIELQAVDLERPLAALGYAERGRVVLEQGAPKGPVISGRLKGLLQRISHDCLILEYAVLPDRLLVWALSAAGLVQHSVSVSAARLDTMVQETVNELMAGRSPDQLKTFAEWLLPADLLRGRSRLLLVPDATLHHLPFAALPVGSQQRPLVQSAEFTISPSILFAIHSEAGSEPVPPRSIVLFGAPEHDRQRVPLPPLPHAGAEVAEVARLYPSPVVFSGESATRARFLEHLGGHQVLHFAGHAMAGRSPEDPAYLVLAGDSPVDSGALYLDQLAGRRFEHLELAVLSACGTVAGDGSRTGGLAGLARPFLAAGVPRVVGTLWPIDDRAARRLLVRFHRAFVHHGRPSRALREAQLDLLNSDDPDLVSPSAWAAFQVVGAFDLDLVKPPQGDKS